MTKFSLILTEAENVEPAAIRAITMRVDEDGAQEVANILEASDMNVLRRAVAEQGFEITHYRVRTGHDYVGGWNDALRVLKDDLFDQAVAAGAYTVTKSAKPFAMIEDRKAAVANSERIARENAAREAAEATARREREARAVSRVDFNAYEAAIREQFEYGSVERGMINAVQHARAAIAKWDERLAAHTAELAKNPLYALSWSGAFVEAAAEYTVALEIVSWFEAGILATEMADHALRTLLRGGSRSTSRSTSVMSNVVEDATHQAWTKAYERLAGKTLW